MAQHGIQLPPSRFRQIQPKATTQAFEEPIDDVQLSRYGLPDDLFELETIPVVLMLPLILKFKYDCLLNENSLFSSAFITIATDLIQLRFQNQSFRDPDKSNTHFDSPYLCSIISHRMQSTLLYHELEEIANNKNLISDICKKVTQVPNYVELDTLFLIATQVNDDFLSLNNQFDSLQEVSYTSEEHLNLHGLSLRYSWLHELFSHPSCQQGLELIKHTRLHKILSCAILMINHSHKNLDINRQLTLETIRNTMNVSVFPAIDWDSIHSGLQNLYEADFNSDYSSKLQVAALQLKARMDANDMEATMRREITSTLSNIVSKLFDNLKSRRDDQIRRISIEILSNKFSMSEEEVKALWIEALEVFTNLCASYRPYVSKLALRALESTIHDARAKVLRGRSIQIVS